MDWGLKTWKEGDKLKYHRGVHGTDQYIDVFAGLYWYAGFGSGTFFRDDGTFMDDCSPQEAGAEAKKLGLTFRYVDSFDTASFKSVQD